MLPRENEIFVQQICEMAKEREGLNEKEKLQYSTEIDEQNKIRWFPMRMSGIECIRSRFTYTQNCLQRIQHETLYVETRLVLLHIT